jgi:hypothetical protein
MGEKKVRFFPRTRILKLSSGPIAGASRAQTSSLEEEDAVNYII